MCKLNLLNISIMKIAQIKHIKLSLPIFLFQRLRAILKKEFHDFWNGELK